jgi:hypothetical protein
MTEVGSNDRVTEFAGLDRFVERLAKLIEVFAKLIVYFFIAVLWVSVVGPLYFAFIVLATIFFSVKLVLKAVVSRSVQGDMRQLEVVIGFWPRGFHLLTKEFWRPPPVDVTVSSTEPSRFAYTIWLFMITGAGLFYMACQWWWTGVNPFLFLFDEQNLKTVTAIFLTLLFMAVVADFVVYYRSQRARASPP